MHEFLFLLALLCFAATLALFKILLDRMAKLSARVADLEQKLRQPEAVPPPEKVEIPPSPLLAQTPPPVVPRPASIPPPLPIPPPIPPPAPAPAAPFNWEAFMGVKMFAWLGGLVLFLGVVFLVRYSFENNLVTPFGRVAIGAAVAGGLIALGWWLARGRYGVTAQSLCATGIVILYADLFAAHSFYGLVSLTTAFFAMSAVTLFSFLLAVNLGAQVIVLLGLLGGFLTPALLRTGADDAPALFLYIALLDLGVAAVALRKSWLYLVLLAAIGTALTQLGWAAQFFDASKGGRAFWIFLGFEALFLAIYFFRRFALRSADPGVAVENATDAGGDSPRASQSEASTPWTTAAAAVSGFTALGFSFWFLAVPSLARQPLFFLGFVFLADAGLLALPVLGRASRLLAVAAGAVAFALVAAWIGLFGHEVPLLAALGAIVVFALLHAATVPAAAFRPGLLPITAAGTVTPFVLLVILLERIELANPTPIFLVGLILSAILLAAAIWKRADWLSGAALLGVALLEVSWQADRFSGGQAIPALVWYGLFLVLFVVFPFCSAEKEKARSWAISAFAQVLQFWLVYEVVRRVFPNEWMGLLPALFILPGTIGVWALRKIYRADPATGDARLAWQGGAFLLFVSLIFPLQFDREWITLGWALEGLALLWLFGRLPHRGLASRRGWILLCAAFARLALNPAVFEYHKRSGTRIWNWYLYAYGVTSFCLLAGARIFGARGRPGSAPPTTTCASVPLCWVR